MIVELDHRRFLAQDYAIINPLQVGKNEYADLEFCRLLPKGLERHQRMMPILLHLSGIPDNKRLDLLERADRWLRDRHMPMFSALFTSARAPDQVRSSLITRMVISDDNGKRVWLRFHDPRVFRHLSWLLRKEQLALLMGPAETWLGFDPLSREWHHWDRPLGVGPLSRRLRFDAGQWRAVEQLEILNSCLRDLFEEGEDCSDLAARELLDGLLESQQQGLSEDFDKKLFARQHRAYGPGLHTLPAIAHRLQQVREQTATYVAACSTLNSTDLRQNDAA